jgi:predicted transcriptional regulator
MNDQPASTDVNFAELTAEMVSAYVSHNSVSPSDLPSIIHSVYASILGLGASAAHVEEKPVPAVPIKKSVTPDYIISLEDGRKFKSLKRTLTKLGMTPTEYRTKWDLPADYPMVAPNYSVARSELAKALGLGQQRRKRPAKVSPKPKRGRKAA